MYSFWAASLTVVAFVKASLACETVLLAATSALLACVKASEAALNAVCLLLTVVWALLTVFAAFVCSILARAKFFWLASNWLEAVTKFCWAKSLSERAWL